VTLESNPDFYLGAPAMERVIVRHVQESASQRLLLERGDIDIARNLNPEDIAGVQGRRGRQDRGRAEGAADVCLAQPAAPRASGQTRRCARRSNT
jgi:ABC-type transport system substrate-binding protein